MVSNNDILRRLRFTFDYNDNQMKEIFYFGGKDVELAKVIGWLKKDDAENFEEISDEELAAFLNGFIVKKRGPKKGEPMPLEKTLNNNLILLKLKIALKLKDTDMVEILKLADFYASKHEISAFFRKPTQRQYRECQNQILRNFLYGLQLRYRSDLSNSIT